MSEDCSVLTHPDNREVCARLWLCLYPAKQDFAHPLTTCDPSMKIVLKMLTERVRVDSQVEGVEEVGK